MRKIKNKKIDISLGKAKSIIFSPMITEKSTRISEYNQFVFKVDYRANVKEIKIAIEKLFKVKVEKVNTNITRGKMKNFKGSVGQRSNVKKAIVTLKEGSSIDMSVGI
tara:strand:- start:1724 stop:2047 length:324 start_codon:yes stop_codon:yes gene_type:complete